MLTDTELAIASRLKAARKLLGMTYAEFCDELGVSHLVYGAWERGEVAISSFDIDEVELVHGVSALWLRSGPGEIPIFERTIAPYTEAVTFSEAELEKLHKPMGWLHKTWIGRWFLKTRICKLLSVFRVAFELARLGIFPNEEQSPPTKSKK